MNRLTKSVAALMLAASAFSFSSCDDDSDVIGLNDATKYGFVKVTIAGEDPNGEDFETTKNFKFAPTGGPDGSSSVITYTGDGFYRYFDVERFIGPFDGGNDNSVYLDLEMQDEEDASLSYGWFRLETTIINSNDEFFYLNESFNLEEGDITSYQYNPETGKLSVKFTKELDGENTNLGQDLTLTVNVSVKVFENIGNTDF